MKYRSKLICYILLAICCFSNISCRSRKPAPIAVDRPADLELVSNVELEPEPESESESDSDSVACDYEWPDPYIELERMRHDSKWIAMLDSMASVAIGDGAKCLDAVQHLFLWNGRYWVHNQDWGGVLEIPKGYVPEEDIVQAELSFHGSGIYSPDSTVRIKYCAGYQPNEWERYVSDARHQFDWDSTITVTSFNVIDYTFPDGYKSKEIDIETLSDSGVKGMARYIYKSRKKVFYSISIEYPSTYEQTLCNVLEMFNRYPLNDNGELAMGDAVL